MRILEVVHGFPPAAQGGTEVYARAHARALRQQHGDDVVVLTREQDPNRGEYEVRIEERDDLRIVSINNTFRKIRTFEETYSNEAIDAIAGRVIDDFKPDVVHVHHLTCLSTNIVRLLAERQIPRIATLHDYWLICHRGQLLDVDYRVCDGPDGCHTCLGLAGAVGTVGFVGAGMVRALERRLPAPPARQLRRAAERIAAIGANADEAENQICRRVAHMREVCAGITHFLAPSRHIRDRFVQFGVAPERITVWPNGVEHEAIGRPDSDVVSGLLPPRRLRLGFLGSLMISKAPHVLLDAARRLPSGSISVDLFGAYSSYHGDDRYRYQLEPFLHDDHVRVHGSIPHEQVATALASIDVLVVPSIWPETSPLVIQEAFVAGVPVVASRIGGIAEIVTDGQNGLLFEAGDVGDLSRTVARLLHEPELRDTLRAGIPSVRSIEDDVAYARGVYEALLTRQPHSARSNPFSTSAAGPSAPGTPVCVNRLAAIVLNFRTPDETLLAVKSVLASRRPVDEIIVVNNDSTGDGRQTLKDVWSRITYIHTGTNLGFSGGMNAGIREALARGADRILLVNSDVIVPPDVVERLERCLDAEARAGIAGPVVLSRSEPDRIASLGMSYAPATGRMRHRGNGASVVSQAPATDLVVDGVSGCLMLINREVFEAVGFFDEDYFFSFEDLDFCLRARRAGFATVLAGRATAYHEGGQSLGALSPRRFYYAARNHLLLARRAGPPASRLMTFYRACFVMLLNLAHAIVSPGGSLVARLGAVAHGTRDYVIGRFGSGL